MNDARKMGRVTIPTDLDVVPQTLEILKKWGADAIRDCDAPISPPNSRGRMPKLLHLLHHPQGQRLGQGEPR